MRPTNGLVILLGKYEHCNIKCGKFKGTNMTEFLDRVEYTGDIFSQLDNIIEFIKKHLNFGSKIEGLQRTDRYEIPLVAIREAVVNALVHRDYHNFGRDIKVGIYDDILNIVSPGSLPMSNTEKNILDGRSEIRNKVIARVFKELKYIERWGSGIKRMMDSCQEYGLKILEIKETGDSVTVNFLIENDSINRQKVEDIIDVRNTRGRMIINTLRDRNIISMRGSGPKTYYILNEGINNQD